jgi:hypothetical protein
VSGLPSSKREEIAANIAALMLVQGVFFDSSSMKELPYNERLANRVFRALVDSGIVAKSTRRGKYLLTDEFLGAVKAVTTRGMRRQIFVPLPDLAVFDVAGIETWTEEELDIYTSKLKARWLLRSGRSKRGR